ncbi:AAA family ATPase [Haliea sp. E1-2-M8]|uniref:AAA family ATPase n=1 Tax=Haliea sp. E1-2-M8 TaxID=3064706 RepID=UPI002715D99C|nr:AAA family ATPase [Haliea sp. E1-2-M8]MDO8861083.1 AAA family ATPase [Haliea sp. E1-2-M8]
MTTSEIIRTATASDFTKPVKAKSITWQMLEGYLCKPKVGPKEGNGFVAAAIDDGPRKNERVGSVSLLVYDLDNKNSVVVADELRHRIESKRYRAIIHSTHSHTPDKPRYRLILAVSEPIMPADHKQILISVAARLGISDALDMNATDLSRFFYRPRCPVEQVGNYVFISVPGAAVDIGSLRSIANQNVIDLCAWRGVDSVNRNLAGVQDLLETDQNYELVRKMLSSVPSDCDRDKWRNIVWSVISLNWSTGKELIREWSMRSDAHWGDPINARKASADLDNVVADYDPMSGTSIGTLFHHATESGWNRTKPNSEPAPERFIFHTASEVASLPPPEWRIKGLLPRQGVAAVYGPSGSGKSFLVLDMLATLTQGGDWFGHALKPCPVIYVALEGTAGIRKRLQAWSRHHGQKLPKPFKIVTQNLSLLSASVVLFAEDIRNAGLCGGVIVIDTLAQSAPGADENCSKDMGTILAHAQLLQRETDSMVLLVHHAGKEASRGMRGHSSLHAALDTVIEVKHPVSGREWQVTKSKDGEGGISCPFRLEPVQLGHDGDGDKITSCVVIHDLFRQPALKEPSGKNQRAILVALRESAAGTGTIGVEEAFAVATDALPSDVSDRRSKERVKGALQRLEKLGHLVRDDDSYEVK